MQALPLDVAPEAVPDVCSLADSAALSAGDWVPADSAALPADAPEPLRAGWARGDCLVAPPAAGFPDDSPELPVAGSLAA